MHYETENLPADVHEVFFSDGYFYASSSARTAHGRPRFVGCGRTREDAFADLRAAATADQVPPAELPLIVALSDQQRQALALNLRELRTARDLTQLDVARRALGFEKSHAAVSRLERGTLSQVARAHIDLLAGFFATTPQALLQA